MSSFYLNKEEWRGQKSHKWTTTRKHIAPSYNNINKSFDCNKILILGNSGRRHFKESLSQQRPFKPCLKVIQPIQSKVIKEMEIKRIIEYSKMLKDKEDIKLKKKLAEKSSIKPWLNKYSRVRRDNYNLKDIQSQDSSVIKRLDKKVFDWKEKIKLELLAEQKKAVSELINWYK